MAIKISIIIPTLNEAEQLPTLLKHLQQNANNNVAEILVSDGGSTDNTLQIAKQQGATAVIAPKGRSAQMHFATQQATGDILYFVHADTIPPASYTTDILAAVENGYDLGRYRSRYMSNNCLLKLNAWVTRFNWFICMGGDQTLFITRQCYHGCGGFNPLLTIMEEYEFVPRAQKNNRYLIMPKNTLISARKYEGRSWLLVLLANRKAIQMFRKGALASDIKFEYQRRLNAGK